MIKKVFVFLLLGGTMSCSHWPHPPLAEKKPFYHQLHNDSRLDNYFWMKERDSSPVIKHLEAENQYTSKVMEETLSLQEKIYTELKSRIKEDDSSPPIKKGPFHYYVRYEKGKEYGIYCRKNLSPNANEEILVDGNEQAKGEKFFQISSLKASPNHRLVAYAVDTVGRRFFTLKIKDLQSGLTLQHQVPHMTGNFAWANDNQTIFLSQQNPTTLRSEKILKFDIQSGTLDEVYYEKDEIFSVGVSKSLSEKFIFISSSSFDSSEFYYLNADQPLEKFKLFLARETKHEYSLNDGGDGFYILTNWQAENFRLMKSPYSAKDKKSWQELIPHSSKIFIEEIEVFKNFLAVQERSEGLTRIKIMSRDLKGSKYINFPDPAYTVELGSQGDYDADRVRYDYSSLVKPYSTYDYVVKNDQSILIKQKEVPTYQSEKYQSERVWAKAKDGTLIPISLLFQKTFQKDSQRPLLLYGYGSYGYSMDPYFNSHIISLVDRGFVFAIAHVRGGSEMGRAWYEAGRMMYKKNTFSDFNDCAEFLVQKKYAHPSKLYAMGGSAGGLLMGAIMNMRPDLYRGVVAQVPFVDVLTTMLDDSIPLTTAEYEQWGNPNEPKAYDYIKSYSPYDNIEKKSYPNLLVITGYHDSQVQYWEPAKWVAKLRDFNTSKSLILLKTDMDSGHSGASGRFSSLKDWALEYSFLLMLENIKN